MYSGKEDKPLLLKQKDLFVIWRKICEGGESGWESLGWKVFSALLPARQMHWMKYPRQLLIYADAVGKRGKFDFLVLFSRRIGLFRCGNIIYLSIFLAAGTSEAARTTEKILTRAVSTTENVISSEDIDPFAAAILEGLADLSPWMDDSWWIRLLMGLPVWRK